MKSTLLIKRKIRKSHFLLCQGRPSNHYLLAEKITSKGNCAPSLLPYEIIHVCQPLPLVLKGFFGGKTITTQIREGLGCGC